MHTQSVRTDAGNAVTLTLLGLAVAILAGVSVLYFMGKSMPQPEPYPAQTNTATTTDEGMETPDPRAGWNTYDSDAFDFSIMYPPGWIVATGTVLGAPVVTLFDATQQPASTSVFGVHELPVRVSLYPQGLPMGGKGEQKERSATIITVPEASALDYVLGSGIPWATAVTFARRPDTWGESGFMYGRVAVQEEELAYMRGDTGVSPEEFDPYAGDTLVTFGFVDATQWNLMSEILRSFSFITEQTPEGTPAPRITVTSPQAGSLVSSPLVVSGEAHGSWYFEGSFPVRLVAADGIVLAEVPAPALEDWMQDAMVPFEVSLVFSTTTATSGTLILMRDNPSGLPEYDASTTVPVIFGN